MLNTLPMKGKDLSLRAGVFQFSPEATVKLPTNALIVITDQNRYHKQGSDQRYCKKMKTLFVFINMDALFPVKS